MKIKASELFRIVKKKLHEMSIEEIKYLLNSGMVHDSNYYNMLSAELDYKEYEEKGNV